jgi:hypothetical protein
MSISTSKNQNLQFPCGSRWQLDQPLRKTIYKHRPNLPSNGGWSAGITLRPRGNPRLCRRRTAASRVPSYHPRAENADTASHTLAKSSPCSPCSGASTWSGLGSAMKGVSREIKSARGLYSLYEVRKSGCMLPVVRTSRLMVSGLFRGETDGLCAGYGCG